MEHHFLRAGVGMETSEDLGIVQQENFLQPQFSSSDVAPWTDETKTDRPFCLSESACESSQYV